MVVVAYVTPMPLTARGPGGRAGVSLADGPARRLAADLRGQLEAPAAEVPRGIAAGLVHDVGEHVGAVRVERALLLGDVVLERRLGELRDRRLELLVVGDGDAGAAGRVDDDRLQPLRAHHRAQAAAPGIAAGGVLHVVDADAGAGHAVLPGRPDADDRHALAVTLPQGPAYFVHALAREVARGQELRALPRDLEE